MQALSRHGPRVAVTLLPLLFALLHVVGVLPLGILQRLDHIIYDARLRWTMPGTLDPRIVIVDVDEKSLAEIGQWPWPRDRMAELVDQLFVQQSVALVGFDTVFAEADRSTGLPQLERLVRQELRDQPGFADQLNRLRPQLDHDQRLANALRGRPVVMGYYFSSEAQARASGQLPAPAWRKESQAGGHIQALHWTGYGANIAPLAEAAPAAGFFNTVPGNDGVVRSLPLMAEYQGAYYESLALAMYRLWLGQPAIEPGSLVSGEPAPGSLVLRSDKGSQKIPVDDHLTALLPFRGNGGPQGGSFRYVSAGDVLSGRLAKGELGGRMVLIGTTAPGLLDLRATPVGEAYPGVETHANLISGLLDRRLISKPDYAAGYEAVLMLLAGLLLALGLPLLSATRAVVLSIGVIGAVVGLNTWLYVAHGLALPMATTLVMAGLAFVVNMSYGYLVESRAKRELAQLFGTYVPPELVDEMVKDPDRYSMTATTREMTVMFCDMRGFTASAETMSPTQLQELLNMVFSRLTHVIRSHRGTIDKYMGDCVMAFWGAPVDTAEHATLAVRAALGMSQEIERINADRQNAGLPDIAVGIGLNTGEMCVGDMGSDVRRSYTVVGDAVNLGSRLEGLSKHYGVSIVASETTRRKAPGFVWQELDLVRVKGKAQAVAIHTPLAAGVPDTALAEELHQWQLVRKAWRTRDWGACETHLGELRARNAKKVLYRLYTERVGSMKQSPLPQDWDGASSFDTK
ncbi:CHASE2 domain-containing protein [Hydrogenophaga sp. RWCD_12]|uniref:CHASE2 domain-containing protein n=1 Tax=Hydrogenophaga sp. RWCD_12 TaxID=3391190 RepID=UPI003984BA22